MKSDSVQAFDERKLLERSTTKAQALSAIVTRVKNLQKVHSSEVICFEKLNQIDLTLVP